MVIVWLNPAIASEHEAVIAIAAIEKVALVIAAESIVSVLAIDDIGANRAFEGIVTIGSFNHGHGQYPPFSKLLWRKLSERQCCVKLKLTIASFCATLLLFCTGAIHLLLGLKGEAEPASHRMCWVRSKNREIFIMSISAAASSAVLASAAAPQRYAIGQDRTSYQANNQIAILKRAKELLREFSGGMNLYGADGVSIIERDPAVTKLAKDFGIAEADALSALGSVENEARGLLKLDWSTGRGVNPSSSPPPAAYQGFGSIEAAKSFAFQQLEQFKAGMASYNAWVKDFDNGGAQKMREQVWTNAFEQIKKHTPETSDAEAIKKADDFLLGYIKNFEGLTFGHLPGHGALQSAFQLSGPLFSTNADGTLSLNNIQARYNGALIFEIGGDIAQNVDKAA